MTNFNNYFKHIEKKEINISKIEEENINNLYCQNEYYKIIVEVLDSCKKDNNKFSYKLLESDYDESKIIALKENKNFFKHTFEIEIEDDKEYQGAFNSKYILRIETENFNVEYKLENYNSGKLETSTFNFKNMNVDFSKEALINCFKNLYDREHRY